MTFHAKSLHIVTWKSCLPDVQRTRHLFLTVQAAVTPTRVLPAPKVRREENFAVPVVDLSTLIEVHVP